MSGTPTAKASRPAAHRSTRTSTVDFSIGHAEEARQDISCYIWGMADLQGAKEYAVGWGSLALINAGLAQGKNRSGASWFLLSLLLGPIATLLIVVMRPVPA